jgi:hypothetical protein
LPLHNEFLLLHNEFLPVHSEFLVLHNEFLSVHSQFLLLHNDFLLAHNEFLHSLYRAYTKKWKKVLGDPGNPFSKGLLAAGGID